MMYLEGRAWAEVILAEPVSHPLSVLHSSYRDGPAAEWMAPSYGAACQLGCLVLWLGTTDQRSVRRA